MSEELAATETAIAIIPRKKTLHKKEKQELFGGRFGYVEII